MKKSAKVLSMVGLMTLSAFAHVPAVFAADYPSTKVKKKMYADNDFRGKKAPALNVQKWLTKEPDTKNKVVLVDFWATWCGPCRAIAPTIEELHADYKDKALVGKLDVDNNPEVAMKYGIRSIPTLVKLQGGRELDRVSGAMQAAQILSWVK